MWIGLLGPSGEINGCRRLNVESVNWRGRIDEDGTTVFANHSPISWLPAQSKWEVHAAGLFRHLADENPSRIVTLTQPIIVFQGDTVTFGAGELCFYLQNDTEPSPVSAEAPNAWTRLLNGED